ncbi:MAG TPA: basic amino acid ABC transporter substrate-binding protein [Gaiellaceae bacterium]|nr:basic amino acid ABC transporter substrate-binding protein [Gaiellaceae bacterium]
MPLRNLTLLIAALLALAVVAGCGGDDDDEGADGPEAAETGAADGEGLPEFSTVEDGVLTVGSDIPFPPFEFREGDELTGFDVDLMEEIASRLGLDEVRWVDTSFDTIFTQLAGGRFDAIASATTITEERSQIVSFTEPYYLAQQALTVNTAETPDLTSVDGLSSGDVVAVQQGTTGEIWARENVPEGVQIRSFPEAPDTYTALEAGNVTAVVFDEPSALSEAERREDLEVVVTIDTGERYGFPVNPENDELLEAMNAVLAEMIEDGTYDEIYSAYPDLPPGGSIAQES